MLNAVTIFWKTTLSHSNTFLHYDDFSSIFILYIEVVTKIYKNEYKLIWISFFFFRNLHTLHHLWWIYRKICSKTQYSCSQHFLLPVSPSSLTIPQWQTFRTQNEFSGVAKFSGQLELFSKLAEVCLGFDQSVLKDRCCSTPHFFRPEYLIVVLKTWLLFLFFLYLPSFTLY